MNQQEKVLCIKRENLPRAWVQKRTTLKIEETFFFDTCNRAGLSFMERGIVETDPSYKQIIPYIVLQTRDGKHTAAYLRNGSEQRLHDLWSIGIGGHINPEDRELPNNKFKEILMAGMVRELDEELIQRPTNDLPRFCGLINEEETPVGSVHLGAVFTLLTDTAEAFIPGKELTNFTWVNTDTLSGMNLELWSTLALELYNPHALTGTTKIEPSGRIPYPPKQIPYPPIGQK